MTMTTFKKLIKTTSESKWRNKASALNMVKQMHRIDDALGDRAVDQRYIDDAVQYITQTWPNPGTARRVGAALKSLVRCAQRYDMLEERLRVELPPANDRERQHLTDEQRQFLSEKFLGCLVYRLLCVTGLRGAGEEMRRLRWSDYRDGLLTITSKKGHGTVLRQVPVGRETAAVLEQRRQSNEQRIVSEQEIRSFNAKWQEVRQVYPHLVPYQIRHSYANHLVRNGVPLHVVKEMLGHASIVTTQRYLHVDAADLTRIEELL